MLAAERHDAIVAQLNRDGSVTVNELSEKFGVTKDSIRKDLTLLEKKGLLSKTYGGAIRPRAIAAAFRVSERKGKNAAAKQAIAARAAELVKDGDTIFLDISTANIELARLLTEMRITAVTNSIDIIQAFPPQCPARVIALGGEVSEYRAAFTGALTTEQLRRYRFDIAFMGVVGVDLDKNRVSTYAPEDGVTKQTALACSSKAYMMLETRKLMEDGVFWYADINSFTGAIMEQPAPENMRARVDAYDIEWLYGNLNTKQ